MISRAIQDGIKEGFEDFLASRCDGYHEPQERCPMRPEDGCACLRHRWRNTPWWKRLFQKEPMPTASSEAVLQVAMREAVDDAVTFALADRMRGK